jgi:hypothetical protein
MGTRALTFVYESFKAKNGKIVNDPIINMYRQYDGYPTGHGAELAEFLNRGRMVNGLIHTETVKELVYNGMPCLAGQLVANFKTEAGQFYLYPTSAKDCGQDFEYHIYNIDGQFKIIVMNCGVNFFGVTHGDTYEEIFNGSLIEFTEFCKEKETV